uniref:Uncharacterized protein n=1 Tax=Anguilla anguilla TaxID=7936 RepID=A0A0E9TBL6_ANGAN
MQIAPRCQHQKDMTAEFEKLREEQGQQDRCTDEENTKN